MAATQSAAIVAAQLMRWDDRVGSLVPGKFAVLIAVGSGAHIHVSKFTQMRFVMLGGTVYKAP